VIRTVERWVQAGVLPPPSQVIRDRGYWDEDTLDAHDRQRTIDAGQSALTPKRALAPGIA
jgi:hypothetical protein